MKFFRTISVIVAIAATSPAWAQQANVDAVQSRLTAQKAEWVAHDNWVNHLSKDEVKRLLGYPGRVRFGKEFTLKANPSALAGTDAIDWRSKDGQAWVTPVLSQGNCGSCVAYATIGTLETQMNIARNAPFLNMRYSADMLFACGGGSCEGGWMPSSAASFLERTGVVDEACMPSTMSATGQDVSCNSQCGDARSRSQRIVRANTPANVEAVKAALKRGPLVTTLDVYADFMVYGSGVYKHTTGSYLGGHAVSIIGFDDAKRAWIIRNSWGQEWGDHGFAYVAYDDESGVGDSTWGFEIPSVEGFVVARNVHDHDFLSGDLSIDGYSSFANTTKLNFVYNGPNGTRGAVSCDGASCLLPLGTRGLPDGRYEGMLSATHDGKSASSDSRYFYVVNSKPTMALSFAPKGFDVSQPQNDRIQFNVTANSAPVPFQSVSLVIKQGDKVITTKTADMVLPSMTMGWRTNLVPNGVYTLQLIGHVGGYDMASNVITVTTQN